jgi:phage portal protein BeeE
VAALIHSIAPTPNRRALGIDTFDDWAGLWGLDSLPLLLQTTMPKEHEPADVTFTGMVAGSYLRNSVVFACLSMRARLFAEVRFQFQQMRNGRPGNLFGTPDLRVLERPEPGKTTRDLLQSAILDADMGGNGFLLKRPDKIRRLRPDWTLIAYGSPHPDLGTWDPDAEVIGFGYWPGGMSSGAQPVTFLAEEVAHFAPTKDPLARNRGISLLTAGLREIMADNSSTAHKLSFFQHAATPNLALKFPANMSRDKALEWIDLFEQEHKGATRAYRTLFLGAGIESTPVGLNFQQMDYAAIQGRAESRIATLTGMHPVVVALSEGLQGSSLNAGNFGMAARLVGDATLRPLWGDMAGSLEAIIPAPPGSRLWYDDREIAFLRSDVTDQADILAKNAQAIVALVKEGFEPASVVDAVMSSDMSRLVHSGLISVQLQPPGAPKDPADVTFDDPKAPPAAFVSTREFWAVDEPLAQHGTIQKGQIIPAGHALVRSFPGLFEPYTPAPVATDLATRARQLLGQGLTVPAIASRIDRTPRHVRRLLNGPQQMAEVVD